MKAYNAEKLHDMAIKDLKALAKKKKNKKR